MQDNVGQILRTKIRQIAKFSEKLEQVGNVGSMSIYNFPTSIVNKL